MHHVEKHKSNLIIIIVFINLLLYLFSLMHYHHNLDILIIIMPKIIFISNEINIKSTSFDEYLNKHLGFWWHFHELKI